MALRKSMPIAELRKKNLASQAAADARKQASQPGDPKPKQG